MSVKFSNNAVTTLSADISAGATSFTVASATPFPTLASGDWTYVSLTSEVVKIDTISGNTFELFENDTVQSPHTSGESVELRMTAELLNDFAEDTESLPIGGGTLTGALDVTGSVTADGLTVDGTDTEAASSQLLKVRNSTTGEAATIGLYAKADNSGGGNSGSITFDAGASGVASDNQLRFNADHQTHTNPALSIKGNGDISFYEDTGTTPKFFWDASAERLGLTGSDYQFYIQQGSNQPWYHRAISNGKYSLHLNGTGDIITADTSGNVGIGTSSPTSFDTNTQLALWKSAGGNNGLFIGSNSFSKHHIYFGTGTANNDWKKGQIEYDTSANKLSFGTNEVSDRMVIDSTGNVGIGETVPEANLHIKNASAGTFTASNSQLLIENNTTVRLSLVSPNTNACSIEFGDVDDQDVGVITYDHSDNYMKFKTNSSERLRIDSAGNLGVGTSNPQSRIDVGGGYMANEQGRTDHVANTMPSPYYHFNQNDYTVVGAIAGDFSRAMTIEFMCYPDHIQKDWANIFDFSYGSGNNGPRMERKGTVDEAIEYIIYMGNGANMWGGGTVATLAADKWHHVVFVITTTATTQSLTSYVNGVLYANTESTTVANFWLGAATNLNIGRGFSATRQWAGDISKFRVYNEALSLTEIKEAYAGNSVSYKYKGASAVNQFSNPTMIDTDANGLADSVANYGTATMSIVTGNGFTGNAQRLDFNTGGSASQAIQFTNTLTDFKRSRISFKYRSNFACGMSNGSYSFPGAYLPANTGNAIEYSYEFTHEVAGGASVVVPTWSTSAGQWFEINDVVIEYIGAVAEYDGSSATTGTWYDKSGNGLDGTVTGATLENKVKALEVANFTSTGNVGIGTTSPYTKLDTTIDSAVEWTTANLSNSANRPNFALSLKNDDTSITGTEVHMLFSAGASGSGQHSIGVKRTGLNTGDMIFRRRTGGASSGESMRIHSNGNVTSKAQNVTTFTVSQRFTAPASSSGTYAIDINNLIGIGFGGTINYTVRVGGYAGAGSNGCTAAYTVGGYAGHSYSATNYDSYGAGTIRNGYASSTGTEYDDRGLGYHPCKNLGAYIANGDIFAFVPTGQKYGFAIKNGGAQAMTIVITVTGSHI